MGKKTREEKIARPEEIARILAAARRPIPRFDANLKQTLPPTAEDYAKAESYYLLFFTQYILGLRVGEVTQLRFEHLEPQPRASMLWVRCPTLKQGVKKPPLVGVPVLWGESVIRRAFDRQRLPVGSQWVFPSPVMRGAHMDKDTVTHAFKRLVRTAGVRDCLTTHSLRHAAASALFARCGNKKTVQHFLRHSDAKQDSTDIYIHETPETWQRMYGCLRLPPLPKD